jgi:hypothetical protein
MMMILSNIARKYATEQQLPNPAIYWLAPIKQASG